MAAMRSHEDAINATASRSSSFLRRATDRDGLGRQVLQILLGRRLVGHHLRQDELLQESEAFGRQFPGVLPEVLLELGRRRLVVGRRPLSDESFQLCGFWW